VIDTLFLLVKVVFKKLYPKDYTADVSTRVSNALLVGAIIGQLLVGLVCDRIGRKTALVGTTILIVIGATLGTAAHGAHGSLQGFFWFMTFARGITGVVRISALLTEWFLADRFLCRGLEVNTQLPPQVQARPPMRNFSNSAAQCSSWSRILSSA